MIIDGASLRTLNRGYSAAFTNGFSGVEPSYKQVATVVPSSTKSNEYGWLQQLPRVREWIGDRQVKNLATTGYTIANKDYELTIDVDRNDIQDDNVGIYTPLFAEMGRAAASFPDELVWPLLTAGFSTTCYDGQYFFDSDHPVLDANGVSQSVSNTGGGSGTPWFLLDLSRGLKPLIFQQRTPFNFIAKDNPDDESVWRRKKFEYGTDGRMNVGYGFWQMGYGSKQTLNATYYAAARAAMAAFTGDHGRPLGVKGTHLVVGPSLEGAARALLMAQKDASGADNVWYNSAQLIVSPWLT